MVDEPEQQTPGSVELTGETPEEAKRRKDGNRRRLHLVSPSMRGEDVREIQWLITGHEPSAWTKKDVKYPIVYAIPLDGVYGQQTANRVMRAKHWLGYDKPDLSAGQDFYDYMVGKKKLSKAMQSLRGERIRHAQKTGHTKAAAVEKLRGHLGMGESPPGSNCQMFGAWYGMNCVPWCAISVSWALNQVGIHFKYSYVPTIVDDATWGRNGLHLTGFPQKGDLFTLPGGTHVGFFDHWTSGGFFTTVEGNWSDRVAANTRHRSTIGHFVRVTG